MIVFALLIATAALQALPPTPPPTPPSTPTAAATAASPLPSTTPAATAPATPLPASPTPATPLPASPTPAGATLSPSATATASPYRYRFVPHPPAHLGPGDPQIFAVYLNDKQLRSLGPIAIRVETNEAVVKVVSRSNGRDGVVPLLSPGVFVANGRLPKIPFIAEGMTLDLQFIATTADGRKILVAVPVRLN